MVCLGHHASGLGHVFISMKVDLFMSLPISAKLMCRSLVRVHREKTRTLLTTHAAHAHSNFTQTQTRALDDSADLTPLAPKTQTSAQTAKCYLEGAYVDAQQFKLACTDQKKIDNEKCNRQRLCKESSSILNT